MPRAQAATALSPFVAALRRGLMGEKQVRDLPRSRDHDGFGFLGYVETALSIELVGAVDADDLTESEIVSRCDRFFDAVRGVPRTLGLGAGLRNPNGLLCFVFSRPSPDARTAFIRRQTRISHSAGSGGIVVAWSVDVASRRVLTHTNPVSLLPPTYVASELVFPGVAYLEALLRGDLSNRDDAVKPRPGAGGTGTEPRRSATRAPRKRTATTRDRLLFLGANSPSRPLDLELEVAAIVKALEIGRRGSPTMKQVGAASVETMMQAVLEEAPTLVHFSAHGTPDGILLRDEVGASYAVTGTHLARLFGLLDGAVRCVVLNACFSRDVAAAIHRYVPHVVGIDDEIADDTAVAFSSGFYQAIRAGKTIPTAFDFGKLRVGFGNGEDEDRIVLLSRPASGGAPDGL